MIYIGTSGYYFKDWIGPVYKKGTKPVDMLSSYFALGFNCLELNFSYYRIPSVEHLARFSREAPDNFAYILKAYKGITHNFEGTQVLMEFLDNYSKGNVCGNFKGVLAQFPESFHMNNSNINFLNIIISYFSDIKLYIEFRSNEWINKDIMNLLKEKSVGYVSVDLPKIGNLPQLTTDITADRAYVRLHGRNMDWYGKGDRYNYLYSENELAEIKKKIDYSINNSNNAFIFFNNCHGGFAVKNALQFSNMEIE